MRALLATFGSFGDVNPFIALALGLRKRGHDAIVAAPAFYRDVIEREGLAFRPVRPDANLEDREILARAMDPRTGIVYLLEEILLPALRDSYDDLRDAARDCDVLVTHPLVYAGPILADATDMPWASTALSPLPFLSTYDPPILSPLRSIGWTRHLGRWPSRMLFGLGRLAVRKWEAPIRELRASLNLSPGRNPIFEGQFSPRLVLALFSESMGTVQPDWPPATVQTGFLTYAGSHDRDGLSPELEAFLDAGAAPIVFTLGTSSVTSGNGFFEAAEAAVRRLGLRAVLVGAEETEPVSAGHPDILRVPSAPFRLLFPRASIVVHPGGIGTIALTLLAGRPSLLVPFAHDHPDNAARLARLGVASKIEPRRCNASRIARELERLRQPEWSQRAARVAERVAAEPGVRGACEALEALARSPT